MIRTVFRQITFVVISALTVSNVQASTINSAEIAAKVSKHIFDYSHFKVIGACVWLQCKVGHCATVVTPELDEYLPDLMVSVYQKNGDDPLWEAKKSIDPVAHKTGSKLFDKLLETKYHFKTGEDLGNGNVSALNTKGHYDAIRRKSVDVIGAPMGLFHIPFLMLRINTQPYVPYYISDLDTLGRLGLAESVRSETYLFSHPIGQGALNHWGYEFPRDMVVEVYNNYKASLITALRAADIVTNHNALHTVKSTSNSCGHNCVIANVIENTDMKSESKNSTSEGRDIPEQLDCRRGAKRRITGVDKQSMRIMRSASNKAYDSNAIGRHEIWQEVYPLDRHIQMGQDDSSLVTSLGNKDDFKGHGRYVLVVWRHYRGCVQAKGRLIFKTVDVGHPEKR